MTEERSIDVSSDQHRRRLRVLRAALFLLAGYVLVSELIDVIQSVLVIQRFNVDLSAPVGVNAQYWVAISLVKVALALLFMLGWRWVIWALLLLPIAVSALEPVLGYGMSIPWFEMVVMCAMLIMTIAYDRQSLRIFHRKGAIGHA